MPSKARRAFDQNAHDIERLLEIHADLGGDQCGRRHRLGVLNKSAIVLITAIWEAYCEDLAAEGLEHLVDHVSAADRLPVELRKRIAKELKSDPNDLAIWRIADQRWKPLLRDRLTQLQDDRNRKLNTPRAENISELFNIALGLSDISTAWCWRNMTVARARKKLDEYVTLRGAIAHRAQSEISCTKNRVSDFFGLIKSLVAKTGGRVNTHVKSITGKSLW